MYLNNANKERSEGFSNSLFILAKHRKTVREDYVKSTSLAVIEHRVHVTHLTQCPSNWVEEGGSFYTICKTLHSTCQEFERQTGSSFA